MNQKYKGTPISELKMKVSSGVLLVVAIIFILTSDENGSKLTTVQGRTA